MVCPPTHFIPTTTEPLTRETDAHSSDRSLTNLIFFLADCVQNGKTDKEDGDEFSKQARLEKLASFQLMMIKHAMMCEYRRSTLIQFAFHLEKMSSRVIPIFFLHV